MHDVIRTSTFFFPLAELPHLTDRRGPPRPVIPTAASPRLFLRVHCELCASCSEGILLDLSPHKNR